MHQRAMSMSSPVSCCSTSGKRRAPPFPPAPDSGASAATSKSNLQIEDIALTAAAPMQEGFYEALGPNFLDAPTRMRSNGKARQGQGRHRPRWRQANVEMHGGRSWV